MTKENGSSLHFLQKLKAAFQDLAPVAKVLKTPL